MASSPQSRQKRALQSFASIIQDEDKGAELTQWLLSLSDEDIYRYVAYLDRAWGLLDAMIDIDKYLAMDGQGRLHDELGLYIMQGMRQDLLWPLSPEELEAVKPADGPQVTVEKGLKVVYFRDLAMIIPMATFGREEPPSGDSEQEDG